MITHPVARNEGLLVEAVGEETVIFDTETRASHALKPLAAAVYAYADGSNSAAEIAELASYRLATVVTEADVSEVIELLGELNLIEAPQLEERAHGLSRRDALKTFAAAGVGAALITTVSASSAMAATTQGDLGDDQSCVLNGSGGVIIPSAGPDANSVLPQPGTTTYRIGSSTFNNIGGGNAAFGYGGNSAAVDPSDYGKTCTYVKYNGGGTGTGSHYSEASGKWQCVPCDGPNFACCQVVCAPNGYGYGWGASAAAPPGYSRPYIGCGVNNETSGCPSPGSPDYFYNPYAGKYCTNPGGKPGS
jgi:hypothetical protein